ncbi:MAG: polyprenol phosphomannose-dependent alpha 1,6 mannosyltransferase MptB, partial [Mycobacterium sp.]|nr:polyprenol phosphomannose-dependent alpha 1,6 mannosyltransferase MptB [Mycobacterium sp.]
MELVPPSAATNSMTHDDTAETDAPAQPVVRLSLARTAVLGGQSFETHLPGAWFFGMPGGLFGSQGTNETLPPVASLALVFGGLILLTRVWVGFLGHLNRHNGFPVKRVVLVVMIWAVPLLLAPPLFSRDVYTYAAQGEMVSHHINPYSYGPNVLGATPFNQLAD